MNIVTYKTLISELPVLDQSFTTKRSTWQTAENEYDWLKKLNDELFKEQSTLTISRQDIFDIQNKPIKELIIKTIYWGYTGGMRGQHFKNIITNIGHVESLLQGIRSTDNPTLADFNELSKGIDPMKGIGLSTFSKLLYFLEIKIDNQPCLILDQRLINVFASNTYDNFKALSKIRYDNATDYYFTYLEQMNQISIFLDTKGENIEQFLFMFGNNLKKR